MANTSKTNHTVGLFSWNYSNVAYFPFHSQQLLYIRSVFSPSVLTYSTYVAVTGVTFPCVVVIVCFWVRTTINYVIISKRSTTHQTIKLSIYHVHSHRLRTQVRKMFNETDMSHYKSKEK